jgi:hypothetical protein
MRVIAVLTLALAAAACGLEQLDRERPPGAAGE